MKRLTLIISILIAISSTTFAKEIHKSFSAKKDIEISCILGSCEIVKSKDKMIYVDVEYTWDDEVFTPKFTERTNKLIIEEKLDDADGEDGKSSWIIHVPDDVEIDFNSATGNLFIVGVNIDIEGSSGTGYFKVTNSKGKYELKSGTGSVKILDCEGEYDLNSGTGSVNINDSKGEFEANSGTGSVKMNNVNIDDSADLNSGTGKVEVNNISGKDFDLELNSGTGSVELDLAGKKINGEYIFTINEDHAKIVCPYKFDKVEELEGENVRKSFKIGKSLTTISLSTGTGKAVLKK